MPQLPLGFDKGLVTSRDPLRLQAGELTICRGAVYRPDDPDRLWKLPGRVSHGPFRPLTDGSLVGFSFNSYENGQNTLLGAVGTTLYHTDPTVSPYIWSNKRVTVPIPSASQNNTLLTSGGPNLPQALAWFEIEMITGNSFTWKTNHYYNGSTYLIYTYYDVAYTSPTITIPDTDPIEINDGVFVQFSSTSGYTVGSKFTFFGYGTRYYMVGNDSTFLKGIGDGYDRTVLITGSTDIPKIIDMDGNIRRFGIQPCQVTLELDSFVTATGSITRASSTATVPAHLPFNDLPYAYDALPATRASIRMTDTSDQGLDTYGNIFLFSGGGSAAGQFLSIDLRMTVNMSKEGKNKKPEERYMPKFRYSDAWVLSKMAPYISVEVSFDTGATWKKIFDYKETYERNTLQVPIPASTNFNEVQVRIITTRQQVMRLTHKSTVVDVRIYDIYVGDTSRTDAINADWEDCFDVDGNSGAAPVDDVADCGGMLGGTPADPGASPPVQGVQGSLARFYYAITEVYKTTLSDGRIMEVESLPSDEYLAVDVPAGTAGSGTDIYGIRLRVASSGNANPYYEGYIPGNTYFRIYRTALTGAPPNMAKVSGDISQYSLISAIIAVPTALPIFQDDFKVAADSLSYFPLPTYTIFNQTRLLTNPPVAFRDACLFRGAIVGIPDGSPTSLIWSLPGLPEYFPEDQIIQATPTDGGDVLRAVATTGESLILFFRRRVMRIRELFFVSDNPINLNQAQVVTLSPSEGLAGGPRSVAQFTTQFGRSVVAWVSDSGIWYTDAAQVYERGVGVHKMSVSLDWENTVDVTRLDETALTYDPVTQTLWFDYYDTQGTLKALAFHVSQAHWMDARQSGEQTVPKVTGPHDLHILTRATGELNGELVHWSAVEDIDTYNVFTEGGTTDEAYFHSPQGDTETFIQTGWMYLGGPSGKFTAFKGNLFHTDWGQNNLDLLAEFREDKRGVIQRISKSAVSLLGSRITRFWLGKAGHSLRLSLRHVGRVIGALGPIVLTLEGTEED